MTRSLPLPAIKNLNPHLEKIFERLISELLKNHLIGSTLVEGSTFTESEAERVLSGEVIHGHTVDEHLELANGRASASYLHRIFLQSEKITDKIIDCSHAILFEGVGSSDEIHPGVNRSASNKLAYTILINKGKPKKYEYENPIKVKSDYTPFLDFHVNRPLAESKKQWIEQLAKLYFHFQMLHPYCDGNGRIGRFLVSAKAAAEKGAYLKFHLSDGPEHLEIMMALTSAYAENKKKVDVTKLAKFFNSRIVIL